SHFCRSRIVPPAPGLPSGIRATSGASISVGFLVPSMKPVRSRSCRYDQLEVSSATDARSRSEAIAARAVSKITSYALSDNHRTASCCVAGITKPSTPTTSSLNPSTSGGASWSATSRQISGRNPATRLTPPIVVHGSRRAEIASTRSRPRCPASASNSRYAWDDVPSAKIPPCGVLMPGPYRGPRPLHTRALGGPYTMRAMSPCRSTNATAPPAPAQGDDQVDDQSPARVLLEQHGERETAEEEREHDAEVDEAIGLGHEVPARLGGRSRGRSPRPPASKKVRPPRSA